MSSRLREEIVTPSTPYLFCRTALLSCLAFGQVPGTEVPEPAPLSPRNASYTIEVELDPETRMLEGKQVLEWRNIRQRPADELWFHLYWNAWRNTRSTWMLEARARPGADAREEEWGWIEVDSVRLLDGEAAESVDLSAVRRFASPDDGNPDDRTVMVVPLPREVGPEETVRIEMVWRAKIPRTFARTGYRGDYFFIAHWFPKLGVHEAEGWNCHQFHAATEFYSDFGVYDVWMTVPEDFVLGATGREIERRDGNDGTRSYRFHQEDVHGFAWTTSPNYQVRESRFEAPNLPPVELRLLIQPEHGGQAERHFAAASAALESYGNWYGPYPYGHLTLVDPAYESGTGGMEYPTLIACGTRLFNPIDGALPRA